MKNSSRPPVRSPVGHKTKRGAELEGTPKTPASFDGSPCKSSCVDSFSQQPNDRRLQSRSRRPLQWNNLAKQGINAMAAGGMTKDLIETTLCPFLHRELKSTGESEAVNALSPICVNAIQGNADQQGGWKAAMKKPSEMPPSLESPKVKDCNAALKRKGHSRVHEDAHWNATEDCNEAGPGSYTSSPQNRISLLSEERIFLWSNAAFNQGLEHEETVCISKNTASSTSCSSARSCSRHKAVIIEGADCEAESKNIDQNPLFGFDGGQSCNATGGQRESSIVDVKNRMGGSDSSGLRDQETKPHGATELSESTLARKLLFENDKTASCALASVVHCDAFPYLLQQKQRSETIEHTDIQKSVLQANQADKDEKDRFEIGLDEIEHEIQRLTERLTELQFQKRAWKRKMTRHGEANAKKAESAGYVGRKGAADKERSAVALLQQRQCKHAAVSGAKRGMGATVLQSPRAQSLRSFHEVVSKVKQESPLLSVRRRVQCPLTANVGKLSELTRSLSAASQIRRKESSSGSSDVEAERSKVLRRLSMSGAMKSSPSNVQGQQKSLPTKGKDFCCPSRMVSSRYSALTPYTCRKKQDRLSSAVSSPGLPQPSTSDGACSPLQKFATLRSGYPSRSGFATPTKHLKPLSSACNLTTSRIDTPKSTAALHKCLESLLRT